MCEVYKQIIKKMCEREWSKYNYRYVVLEKLKDFYVLDLSLFMFCLFNRSQVTDNNFMYFEDSTKTLSRVDKVNLNFFFFLLNLNIFGIKLLLKI